MNKARGLFFLFIISSIFIPSVGAEVNPYNYRKDYYRMPVWDKIEERALLETTLNTKLSSRVPQTPVEVKDREGNVVVISGGKRRYAISRDGTATYFANNSKTHSRRRLKSEDNPQECRNSGELYLFRTYVREGEKYIIFNEWGEITGFEIWGASSGGQGIKLLERQDYLARPTHRYDYDDTGYWELDVVNRIWKRYEQEMPVVEMWGARDERDGGQLHAYWRRGEFFGIEGLWRIERDWNGQEIADARWTLYDEFAKEYYATYNQDGALLRRYTWEGHRIVLEEDLQNFRYSRRNDFGSSEGGDIWDTDFFSRWQYHWQGSKLIDAINEYGDDVEFYDRREYDINENLVRIERRDKETGRLIVVLNENIDFSVVKESTVEQLAESLGIERELAQGLFNWIAEMKQRGKADASLFGQRDFAEDSITLHDEFNRAFFTLRLNN